MSAGERVTWEICPRCGRCAAVAWRHGHAVAADCPGDCGLRPADVVRWRTDLGFPS
ncbi:MULTISPECIES: hypothetical protein [unclassified Blastococcus]